MILKMKKEKRQKEENEVDDILNAGTGGEKVSEEDQKRANMRKQLADKLKSKLNLKK